MKKLKLMVMKTKSSIRTHRSLIFSIAEIVGVAGVSFVSYWTGKRVSEKIKELKEKNPDISKQEIFKEVWLDLLPMFGSVTGVIVLIILNEKLTEKEKAELITAIASGAGTIEANKRKRERLAKETEDHSKDGGLFQFLEKLKHHLEWKKSLSMNGSFVLILIPVEDSGAQKTVLIRLSSCMKKASMILINAVITSSSNFLV